MSEPEETTEPEKAETTEPEKAETTEPEKAETTEPEKAEADDAAEPAAPTSEPTAPEEAEPAAPADKPAEPAADKHDEEPAAAPAEPASHAPPTPAKGKGKEPVAQEGSAVHVSGNPGCVKVSVDQAGRVGIWTAKPASLLHLHSDDAAKSAQVTVTGSTAGFAFGSRAGAADAPPFELFADETGVVFAHGSAKLATFAPDGTAKVQGKIHAESFEVTSSRAFKSKIEPFPLARAHQVLDGLNAVQYEFARSGESHVGFIAEDVPDEVSNGTHTSLKVVDIVSVLACVVKEQRETIARLEARVASLETRGQ